VLISPVDARVDPHRPQLLPAEAALFWATRTARRFTLAGVSRSETRKTKAAAINLAAARAASKMPGEKI